MEYLFERLGLNDDHTRSEVARVIATFYRMRDYSDNSSDIVVGNPGNPNDYEFGLETLKKNGIIIYEKLQRRKSELLYYVTVINRYNLEVLNRELYILRTRPERLLIDRAIPLPRIPNVTYYDLSSGDIIINGKVNTLHKTNKKLFDSLFIAYPERASRSELLKIVGVSKRDLSQKIILNEAFSNLRKACGVKARIISLNHDGARLNGRAYPLSAQIPRQIFNR